MSLFIFFDTAELVIDFNFIMISSACNPGERERHRTDARFGS